MRGDGAAMPVARRKGMQSDLWRNKIIRTAGELFLSRGYDNVSLDDVAREVELYEPTLRLFFRDKASLYVAVILRGARVLDATYAEHSMGEAAGLQKLGALGRALIDYSRKYPDDYRALYELPPVSLRDGDMEALYGAVEACARDGSLGPPELALYLIALAIGTFARDSKWKAAMEAGGLDYGRLAQRFPAFADRAIRGCNRKIDRSDTMAKTNVKKDGAAPGGSTVKGKKKIMQLEVFPERLLNFETAQRLIDELNGIGGIARMVVHGPRIPPEDPDNLLDGKFGIREPKRLDIKGEMVELTVQVGRIWIEVEDAGAVEKIRKACEKALPFSFELYEGLYFRRKKTVSDYARMGRNADALKLGMFDPKDKRARCGIEGTNKSCENEQL